MGDGSRSFGGRVAVGGQGGLTDGVGLGGDVGHGGLGGTRAGNGGDYVASAVQDIVRQIEAGIWHTHVAAVGPEVVGIGGMTLGPEVVGIGGVTVRSGSGSEVVGDLTEQVLLRNTCETYA